MYYPANALSDCQCAPPYPELFTIYTTPTLLLTLEDECDLTLAKELIFKIVQGPVSLIKQGEDVVVVDATSASVFLSQAETGMFRKGPADYQLDWIYDGDLRSHAGIGTGWIDDNLDRRVI